jgi:hypothetical protein
MHRSTKVQHASCCNVDLVLTTSHVWILSWKIYKYDGISSKFYQNQNKIVIGPPLAKQILNCSRNIINYFRKDWNSTYSNILLHAFSISGIYKKEKSHISFLRRRKKVQKRNQVFQFRLRIEKMEFYRIMTFWWSQI